MLIHSTTRCCGAVALSCPEGRRVIRATCRWAGTHICRKMRELRSHIERVTRAGVRGLLSLPLDGGGLEWGCTAHQRSPHLTGLPSWKSEMCSGQTSRSFTTSVTPATDATVARSLSAALGEIGPLSVTRP